MWANYPETDKLLRVITPGDREKQLAKILGAAETDVTGGMADKVEQMLRLVETIPGLCVQIFSGKNPKAVRKAILGAALGTTLQADPEKI